MKLLEKRGDIGIALNSMKYPVIVMDIGKELPGWEKVYAGNTVRVMHGHFDDGFPRYTVARPTIFVDNYNEGIPDTVENRLKTPISLMGKGAMLVDRWTPEDVIALAETASAPVVHSEETVVVVYKWVENGKRRVAVKLMKLTRATMNTSPVAKIVDID